MKSCIMILYHANYFQSTRRYNYIGYTLNYSITCLQIKKLAVSMLQDCEYANYSSDFVPWNSTPMLFYASVIDMLVKWSRVWKIIC